MKQATFPAIMARSTMADRSDVRCGAIAPSAPSWIPIDPRFEKPHSAYVAITEERSCVTRKIHFFHD